MIQFPRIIIVVSHSIRIKISKSRWHFFFLTYPLGRCDVFRLYSVGILGLPYYFFLILILLFCMYLIYGQASYQPTREAKLVYFLHSRNTYQKLSSLNCSLYGYHAELTHSWKVKCNLFSVYVFNIS